MSKEIIKVEKINQVYLKLEAEPSIRAELTDYFSFEVPGYKFTPQYRNRVWDGKIRLYSYATGQLYVGLYPYLQDWANRKNIIYRNLKSVETVQLREVCSILQIKN